MDTVSMQVVLILFRQKHSPVTFLMKQLQLLQRFRKRYRRIVRKKKTEKIQANVPQRAEELQNHQKT